MLSGAFLYHENSVIEARFYRGFADEWKHFKGECRIYAKGPFV